MICIIALVVFAILGLISAKYRAYFFEALDCVFKKATLRKCTTSFDKKMKMKITTRLSKLNSSLGRTVFKHFETISWIFTILMIASMIWSAYVGFMGVYNWVAFGNCYGPDSTQACVLNNLTGKVQPAGYTIITDTNLSCDTNLLSGQNLK
ncbi:MAG: hypothetical protein WC821_03725 [archaeon]|jgi:hypothetical protein